MIRILLCSIGALFLVCCLPADLLADWPSHPRPDDRGPGSYCNLFKIFSCLAVFWTWVHTTLCVNRASQSFENTTGFTPDVWSTVMIVTFLVGLIGGALGIPIFFAGFPVLLLAYIVPLVVYIVIRNGKVPEAAKVLTKDHLKNWFANLGSKRSKSHALEPWQKGAPIEILPGTKDDPASQGAVIKARQDQAFLPMKDFLESVLKKHAGKVLLDYSAEGVTVRLEVDGMWHNGDAMEREKADPILAVLKTLSSLNPEERRARQEGKFIAVYHDVKYASKLTSQGTKTGERAVLEFDAGAAGFKTLSDIGMRDKIQEQLQAAMAAPSGMVIFSSPPVGGLSTTWEIAFLFTDRLLRDFVAVEDVAKPETHVENVDVSTFNAAAGETPMTVLPKLMLKEPEVLVMPNLVNGETAEFLCDQANKHKKLVFAAVPAKEAVEALLRVLLLKVPAESFAKAVHAVVNQRLIRKLCENCKQPYEPPPQLLQRLGIPPGRVTTLYREWQPTGDEKEDKKFVDCETCGGIRYRGRTAIFEFLSVDDSIRQVLVKQPKLEVLRKYARQAGCRSMQEEGILLVARGVTSLNELQRVLKQ